MAIRNPSQVTVFHVVCKSLFCSVLVLVLVTISGASWTNFSCDGLRDLYVRKGFSVWDVPREPVRGPSLVICQGPSEESCCTRTIEHKLSAKSRLDFDSKLSHRISEVANGLRRREGVLDEQFLTLLNDSRAKIHEMFVHTYGILYEQNSRVFSGLYDGLEANYREGEPSLEDVLDDFFRSLYQQIFVLMNSHYTFDEGYLRCAASFMSELQPFGDTPKKLKNTLIRSFVATRSFSKALGAGAQVAEQLLKVQLESSCAHALMRLTYCPACQGHGGVPACHGFCVNVLQGCLAFHALANEQWNDYTASMSSIYERLVGSFNLQSVVEPLRFKISNAIMEFQEGGPKISARIFERCGKPRLGRRSAQAPYEDELRPGVFQLAEGSSPAPPSLEEVWREREEDQREERRRKKGRKRKNRNRKKKGRRRKGELELQSVDFDAGAGGLSPGGDGAPLEGDVTPTMTLFESALRDAEAHVSKLRDFLLDLPTELCLWDARGAPLDQGCWTGRWKGNYTERAMPAGPDQSSNPEVSINALVAVNSDVNDQIVALKMISQNLKSAYNGISVNWREYAEWQSRHASSPPRGHVPSPPLPPTRPAEEAQGQIQMTAPQVEVEEGSGSGAAEDDDDDGDAEDFLYPPFGTERPTLRGPAIVSDDDVVDEFNFDDRRTSDVSGESLSRGGLSLDSLWLLLWKVMMPAAMVWYGGIFL